MKKYTYIDLFAGCGGLSLGLSNAGWHGFFAIEKSPFAFETLKHNLIDKKKHFEWCNWLAVKNYDIDEILTHIKVVPRYTHLCNAIPPLFAAQVGNVLKELLAWKKN